MHGAKNGLQKRAIWRAFTKAGQIRLNPHQMIESLVPEKLIDGRLAVWLLFNDGLHARTALPTNKARVVFALQTAAQNKKSCRKKSNKNIFNV
jgi:hypothetical protein